MTRVMTLMLGAALLVTAVLQTATQAAAPTRAPSGLLLGAQVRYTSEYRTLWIAPSDGRWRLVAEGRGLLVPRRSGFWWVGIKPADRDWFDTFLWAAPVGRTPTVRGGEFEDAEDLRRFGGVREISVTFLGPDHVSVDETFETHGPKINYNQLLNMFDLDALQKPTTDDVEFFGLDIDAALGAGSRRTLELAGKKAARSETEMAEVFDPDWVDYSRAYWGIVRGHGRWRVIGRGGHGSGSARGYYLDYELPVSIPRSVTGLPATPGPTWDLVLENVPDATDAFTSPAGNIVVVVTPRRLWVHPLDGRRLGAPLAVIPLRQELHAVMVQWAVGAWVDRWGKQVVPLLEQGIPSVNVSRSP